MCKELMNKELWEKFPNEIKLRYSIGEARIGQLNIKTLIGFCFFIIMALIFWVSGAILLTLVCLFMAFIICSIGIILMKKNYKNLLRTVFREASKKKN